MKFLKLINEHRIKFVIISILIFLLPIIIVHVLYKIPAPHKYLLAEWDAGGLLNYLGIVLGASATIIAIILTLTFTVENQKNERKLSIKPFLHTLYVPKFARIDSVVNEGQTVYVTYPLDEKRNIGTSHKAPYILEKVETDKIKGILDSLSFYKENYIIKYTLSNHGAGNAINIKFAIDGKQIMQPFSLAINSSKDFIIILKSELISNGNELIKFSFEYEDVASIGKYRQSESIEFYTEADKSLNAKQAVTDILTIPQEI